MLSIQPGKLDGMKKVLLYFISYILFGFNLPLRHRRNYLSIILIILRQTLTREQWLYRFMEVFK